jgi:hypothetical protein
VVPVEVPLQTVSLKLDAQLPKTESRDWVRATKKGKSPEVDVRYKVWRDPIKLTAHGSTLRVVVPLRYSSDIRAKLKKPIKGWMWLTRGESWGTVEDPQKMEVTIDLSLSVGEDYNVHSQSKLVSIKHGEPPAGDVCVHAGVKVCIPKKLLASHVEDELNSYLTPKLEAGLKKGDTEISKLLALRSRVTTLWSALAKPVELHKPKQLDCPTQVGAACSRSAWLALTPVSLALSPLEVDSKELGVRVELQGKLALSTTKPKAASAPLPKLKPLSGPTQFALSTSFEIPLTHLSEQLSKGLASLSLPVGTAQLKVKSASVTVTSGEQKTIVLELQTDGAHAGKLRFSAKLDYDAKRELFGLSSLAPDAETKALFEKELKELKVAELEKAILHHASIAVGKASEALRRSVSSALSTALPGKLQLTGTLSEVALEDFSLSQDAIVAKVALSGPLSVEFTP